MNSKLWFKEYYPEVIVLIMIAVIAGAVLWHMTGLTGVEKATIMVALIAAGASFVVFWLTKAKERKFRVWQRKEENYKKMMSSIKGFVEGEKDTDKAKSSFMTQYYLLYLYAPDEVIKLTREFFDLIMEGKTTDTNKVNLKVTELVNKMREDINLPPITVQFNPVRPVYEKEGKCDKK